MAQRHVNCWCALPALAIRCLVCLIMLGCSLKAQAASNNSTLPSAEEMAAYHGDAKEILRLLSEGFDVNHLGKDGLSLLSYAVSGSQLSLVKLLLAKGADPKADGGSSMVTAADLNNLEMLQCLLSAGGNPNAHFGTILDTPLIWAARRASVDAVSLLLRNGANPNEQNALGWSPLMVAGSGAVARILIDHGADLNARDKKGMTALMSAAMWGKLDRVDLLLKAGADTALADARGWTAETYAEKGGFKEIVKRLRGTEAQPARLSHKPEPGKE